VVLAQDYNWWWRSMLTSGSSGLYLFLYGIFYYSTKVRPRIRMPNRTPGACLDGLTGARPQLNIMGFTSGLMYFGYMFLASYAFAVGTGTIGFVSSFVFVRVRRPPPAPPRCCVFVRQLAGREQTP